MDLEDLRKKLRGEEEPAPAPPKKLWGRMLADFKNHDTTKPCEGNSGPCGRTPTELIPCQTQHHDEEQNVNPVLCVDCAKEYNQHWEEMWREYHSGLL